MQEYYLISYFNFIISIKIKSINLTPFNLICLINEKPFQTKTAAETILLRLYIFSNSIKQKKKKTNGWTNSEIARKHARETNKKVTKTDTLCNLC